MGKTLIDVKDIVFRYHKDADKPALDQVSLHVNQNEWLAIVGHNGSGKSTLARVLNGLILPDAGTVKVGEIELKEESVWDIRKRSEWSFKTQITNLWAQRFVMMWLLV